MEEGWIHPNEGTAVAYLTLIRIPGDADELFETQYKTMSSVMSRVGPENGQISHVAAKTDEGLLIVNLWESKEGSEAASQHPDVQQAQQEASQESGISRDQLRFEHYDVLNFESAP